MGVIAVSTELHGNNCVKLNMKGGMGFSSLENFNTVMLAKQYWKLIQFPKSLVGNFNTKKKLLVYF